MMRPDALAELGVRRIDQEPPAGEQDDRPTALDAKLGQPPATTSVIDIHPLVEQAVSDRKLAQPLRIAIKARSHDPNPQSESLQCLPPPKQRLQHKIAKRQLAPDERTKLRAGNREH
jgi:hypothetical protein